MSPTFARPLLGVAVLLAGCNAAFGLDGTALRNENPRLLRFDNSASGKDLVDFPVLVTLDGDRIRYEDVVDPATQLRFFDPDTGTDLAFEIERWDPTGRSDVWVEVPKIDARSTTDHILMFYGADAGGAARPADVWSSSAFVFHGDPDRWASSVGEFPGTAIGVSSGEGIIGRAPRLTGSGDSRLRFANSASLLDGWDAFSIELWIYADYESATLPPGAVAVLGNNGALPAAYLAKPAAQVRTLLELTTEVELTTSGTPPEQAKSFVPLQTWIYVAYTFNGRELWIYNNGAFADVLAWGSPQRLRASGSAAQLTLGFMTRAFVGLVDEVRISRSYRDVEWINAQYLSMTGKLMSFVAPGSEP